LSLSKVHSTNISLIVSSIHINPLLPPFLSSPSPFPLHARIYGIVELLIPEIIWQIPDSGLMTQSGIAPVWAVLLLPPENESLPFSSSLKILRWNGPHLVREATNWHTLSFIPHTARVPAVDTGGLTDAFVSIKVGDAAKKKEMQTAVVKSLAPRWDFENT
jgi:hypothetical protein